MAVASDGIIVVIVVVEIDDIAVTGCARRTGTASSTARASASSRAASEKSAAKILPLLAVWRCLRCLQVLGLRDELEGCRRCWLRFARLCCLKQQQ